MIMTKLALSLALFASIASPAFAATAAAPDFGPNVLVFNPSTPPATIQAQIDKVYATQRRNEFGPERNAFLFLPGNYNVDVPVGFYTQVLGLGASPDGVHITGNVHSDAAARNNNATTTFWRAAENFSIAPTGGSMQWAVSQAVPFRRMHVQGDIVLHQNGGWASGGWVSDTLIDGNVAPDRRLRQLQRPRPIAQHQQLRHHLARRIHTRKNPPHRAVLHRPPEPRQRRNHQRAVSQGQKSPPHPRHL